MKLLHSDGRELTVRDLGEVVMRLRAGPAPIKLNGWHELEDAEARAVIRQLLDDGAVKVDI